MAATVKARERRDRKDKGSCSSILEDGEAYE